MTETLSNKTLYRSARNKKITGVCAGLASYWNLPAWGVRAAAVVALICMPTVVAVAYLVASLLLPSRYL